MSRTARCTAAALVLAVPVVAETARPELFDTAAGHLLFAGSQGVGWALLASVVADAPQAARAASPRGRRTVLGACALQLLFALAYAATAVDGEPFEGVFLLFLLGFLALLVGGPLWAARLLRQPAGRFSAAGLLAVAVLGAVAVLVEVDPVHDIALVGGYAAWVLVGRGLSVLDRAVPEDAAAKTPSAAARADGIPRDVHRAERGRRIRAALTRLRITGPAAG